MNINVKAGATAPAALAAEVVARGADVGFALDGDADRLIAVDASGAVVDGDQVLGILALDRLARGVLTNGGARRARSSRTAASRRSSRRPAGGSSARPSATSTSSRGCRSAARRSAARRAATSSSSSTRPRATASSPRSRSCGSWPARGAPLHDLAARIPLLPQQQRAVPARHRDQWEGDLVLQGAIREARHEPRPGRPDPRPAIRHGTGPAGDGRRHRRTTCRRIGRSSWPLWPASD